MTDKQKTNIFIISGPSGVGKNAVISRLLEIFEGSKRILNTTSRDRREGELDLHDFRFVNVEKFISYFERDEFLEAGQYAGNCYGTLITDFEDAKKESNILFWTLDVKGLKNVQDRVEGLTSIFINENLGNIRKRLEERGFKEANLEERTRQAEWEMSQAGIYDYTVTNHEGKLAETVEEIVKIIKPTL